MILRYNPDEARNLKAYGELPETGSILTGSGAGVDQGEPIRCYEPS